MSSKIFRQLKKLGKMKIFSISLLKKLYICVLKFRIYPINPNWDLRFSMLSCVDRLTFSHSFLAPSSKAMWPSSNVANNNVRYLKFFLAFQIHFNSMHWSQRQHTEICPGPHPSICSPLTQHLSPWRWVCQPPSTKEAERIFSGMFLGFAYFPLWLLWQRNPELIIGTWFLAHCIFLKGKSTSRQKQNFKWRLKPHLKKKKNKGRGRDCSNICILG
jgi:hypothetical protein